MTVPEILNQELTQLKNDVIKRHEQAGQVASGKTSRSFNVVNVSDKGGQLDGLAYVGVLERGRRGGKVPAGFQQILKDWATAKGITFESQQKFNTWAYFVSKKIQKEGTALFRSGQQKDIFTTPIQQLEKRLSEKLAIYYQMEVRNEIFKF